MCDKAVPVRIDLAIGSAIVAIGLQNLTLYSISALPFAYAILSLIALAPEVFRGWRNDYSYGVYIYAFPVQQSLVHFGVASLGLAVYLLASSMACIVLAIGSWHLIERPLLAYKSITRPRFTHIIAGSV
jgi:peptidoglycan/LPS O-acetylase OafA/YrhL